MNIVVKGIGGYVPDRVVTSAEAEELANFSKYGVRNGLCKMLTGCEERRYSAPDEYSSDIAAKAGARAIKDAGLMANDIDAVIYASVTHDFAEPATVNVVMDLLDIRKAYGFDVKNACNAFLSAMDLADSLIKTRKAETILVVAGEALSKWLNYEFDSKDDLLQRAPVTLSVGDGGGAFVLAQSDESDDNTSGILGGIFKTIPEYWNNNVVWGGGVRFPHDNNKMFIPGTTKTIIDKQRNLSKELMPVLQNGLGWDFCSDIDCYIPTQVAKWLNKSMADELGFPIEKIVEVVHKFGNMGAANIPIATCEAVRMGMLSRGDKVLMAGVGVGINIGAIAMVY